MPHSHTSFKYHIIFATKYRSPWITPEFEPELYAYIGGILRNKKGQIIEIGGIENHIHILAGFPAARSPAGMVSAIKSNSSSFGKKKLGEHFRWQGGYAGFSVSESMVPTVRRYIRRQKEHHQTMSYEDEIRELCRRHCIEFDEAFFDDEEDSEE